MDLGHLGVGRRKGVTSARAAEQSELTAEGWGASGDQGLAGGTVDTHQRAL